MPSTKPTLGYASRTEAVLALRAEGLSEYAIAEKIGVSRNAIAGLIANARHGHSGSPRPVKRSDGNYETRMAKADGILLATQAAMPLHRPTSDGACRVVEVRLSEAQYAALVTQARAARLTPSALAKALLTGALREEA